MEDNRGLQTLLFFIFWPCHTACEILVLRPGIKPAPSSVKCRVLTTGPPGKSSVSRCFFISSDFFSDCLTACCLVSMCFTDRVNLRFQGVGGGIDGEFGIDTYTLLYLN